DPGAEARLAGGEGLLQPGQRQALEALERLEALVGDRRGGRELAGDRVIGHNGDSRRLAEAVQGHPVLARALALCADAPVSLVGGAVRDALLGVGGSGGDLDLVVEGDAPALAERLGHALSARV